MNETNKNISTAINDVEELLGKLRKIESKNMQELFRWKIIIGILGTIIFLSVILDPNPVMIVDGLCLAGLFILYTYSIRQYKMSTLHLSVKELLLLKQKRARFFQPVTLAGVILSAPLIYNGISILFTRYLHINIQGCSNSCFINIFFALFFASVLLLAYFVWRRKTHPILISINKCLEDLLSE